MEPKPELIDLCIDVSAAVNRKEEMYVAATVRLPGPATLGKRPVVAFGFPGAGYSRGYFLFDMPGSEFGGQAGYHATRHGWIFVACDHLGVGDSSVPQLSQSMLPAVLSANGAAVDHVLTHLACGSLSADFPPIVDPLRIGIGHSMGGNFTVALQGTRPRFHGVAILGYSAVQTVLPKPEGRGVTFTGAEGDNLDHGRDEVFRYAFHWSDVPHDIAEIDTVEFPTRRGNLPPWASATLPGCVDRMPLRGVISKEAAAIDVPVFVGVGERDIVPDLHQEAACFPHSRDVTLFCQPQMAHMHNFASTRARLWERLGTWVASIGATPSV